MSRQHLDARDQNGLASLVIVSVLVVLLTLISLGFARLMSRSYVSSTNRQLSNSATYAAQSGINDVVAYMKQYAKDHPADPYVASPECTGTNSLIGSSAVKGPFYFDSNLSNDASRNTAYSCILLDQTPTSLIYNAIQPLQSRVVKLTTSAFPGSFNSIMLSWQATNQTLISSPPASPTLYDETSWNNSNYTPMLRVTIYPVPYSGATNDIQTNSRTVYLYPQPDSGGVIALRNYNSVDPVTGVPNGSVLPVSCTSTSNPAFNGKPDYRCNLIISSLLQSVSDPIGDPLNYIYVRITPIYGQADVEIRANDTFRQPLRFIGVQAVVDVTARTANVSKRLQARVNIGDETSDINDNISPNSNDLPEFGIRSADALCKQLTVHHSYYDYITFDSSSSNICNTSPNIVIPSPQIVTLSITANDGPDFPKTKDSQTNTPVKGGCINPLPDSSSPASGCYYGTVYVNSAATINWHTKDIINCTGSGTDGAWNGMNILNSPPSTWTGSEATGSLAKSGISIVQTYNLSCTGPGGGPVSKTVHAWPQPSVSLSGPGSVHAGDSFNLNWHVNAADNCTFSGDWNDSSPRSYPWGPPTDDYKTNSIAWNDHGPRSYTITCTDPIGRTASATWTLSTSGGGGGTLLPPNCSTNWGGSDNGNGTGNIYWSAICPSSVPGGEMFAYFTGCSGDMNNVVVSQNGYDCLGSDEGWVGAGRSLTVGVGTYCGDFWSGVNGWGTITGPESHCITINWPPLSGGASENLWFRSPLYCDSGGHHWCATPINAWCTDPAGAYLDLQVFIGGVYEGGSTSAWPGYVGYTRNFGWVNNPNGESFIVQCRRNSPSDGIGWQTVVDSKIGDF